MKKLNESSTDTRSSNGVTSKKKPIAALNSGFLLKQQPIVKLQSSPDTGSDTDNEIDDRFDKKYEELLTFETHEDERREQRLLKALSDIAAKAKQKIQSITDTNVPKNSTDSEHNHRLIDTKTTTKTLKDQVRRSSESRDERDSNRRDSDDDEDDVDADADPDGNDDYSPQNKKHASRRSRRDSTSSSSKDEKTPYVIDIFCRFLKYFL